MSFECQHKKCDNACISCSATDDILNMEVHIMKKVLLISLSIFFTLAIVGCNNSTQPKDTDTPQNPPAKNFNIVGSSTVYPFTLRAIKKYSKATNIEITLKSTGTGGGFRGFCNGEASYNNATRKIRQIESDFCATKGIKPIELKIGIDAIVVVVNPKNQQFTCMTTGQLKELWKPGSNVNKWSDLNTTWSNETINLYGPSSLSGTFDFFTEEIVGNRRESRTDYFNSEEDNVLVDKVKNDVNGLLYITYETYQAHQKDLKLVDINYNGTCVTPSFENLSKEIYKPLSRVLSTYVSDVALKNNSAVKNFGLFMFDDKQINILSEIGYTKFPKDVYNDNITKLQ